MISPVWLLSHHRRSITCGVYLCECVYLCALLSMAKTWFMKIEQQPIYQIKRFWVSLIGLARAILKSLEIGQRLTQQRWLRVLLPSLSVSWATCLLQHRQPSSAIVIRQDSTLWELKWCSSSPHKGSSIGNLLTHSISLSFLHSCPLIGLIYNGAVYHRPQAVIYLLFFFVLSSGETLIYGALFHLSSTINTHTHTHTHTHTQRSPFSRTMQFNNFKLFSNRPIGIDGDEIAADQDSQSRLQSAMKAENAWLVVKWTQIEGTGIFTSSHIACLNTDLWENQCCHLFLSGRSQDSQIKTKTTNAVSGDGGILPVKIKREKDAGKSNRSVKWHWRKCRRKRSTYS